MFPTETNREILLLVVEIDEFRGRRQALQTLSPE